MSLSKQRNAVQIQTQRQSLWLWNCIDSELQEATCELKPQIHWLLDFEYEIAI